jgi:hypothetical protein
LASQLLWTGHLLVVDLRIVPVKAPEVLAPVPEHRVCNGLAVAVVVWILAPYHPIPTSLRTFESLVALIRVTSIVVARTSIVESRSRDVKMDLVAVADFVRIRAEIGRLQNDSFLIRVVVDVGPAGQLEAPATAFRKPVVAAETA